MKIAHKTKQYFNIKIRDYRRQKEINLIYAMLTDKTFII